MSNRRTPNRNANRNPNRNADLPIGNPRNADLPIGTPPRNADLPIGTPKPPLPPATPRGWRSRGYLPHLDSATLTQAVTVHLADSLPKEVLEKLQSQIAALPEEQQDRERRQRIEAYLDAGHGCCILREPSIARMVQDAFLFFHAQRYTLRAWVVMPNHIHVLFTPINGWTLNKIVASWKKRTAREIFAHWRAHPESAPRNADLPIGNPPLRNADLPIGPSPRNANLPIRRRLDPVWHPEFWDRYIRDQQHFNDSLSYIHRNPVKAGLVAHPEDWPWSSASPQNANLLIRPSPPHGTRIS